MEKLSEVEWIWNEGKVTSKIVFGNGKSEVRTNEEPPPTKPSHDIAHFICGFNGNLEWDYENEPNHIAEYNAVFMENILSTFSSHYYYGNDFLINNVSNQIDNYMKWFSEDYYKISKDHPDKKTFLELKKEFLDNINFNIVCSHFDSYYKVWILEELLKTDFFNVIINMKSDIDFQFDLLYNFLKNLKETLYE